MLAVQKTLLGKTTRRTQKDRMKIKTPYYNWQTYNFGSISLCMIMRDSAKVLPRCLNSVAGLADEIIIVDTGSADNSVDIARSHGAQVVHDPWQDDFARPRNIGIGKARCNWILIMDPDEMLLQKNHTAIKWLTRTKTFDAFWLTTRNYGPLNYRMDYKSIPKTGDPLGKYPGYVPSTKTRFFRNGAGIRFEGCWHELADWYIRRYKLRQGSAPIPIHHWTHEISQKTRAEKTAFYLKMGEKKIREWPKHAQARWELATAEMAAGLRKRACSSLATAFRLGFNRVDQYYKISKCQRILGNKEKSDLAFEKGVCQQYPALTHINPNKKPLSVLLDGL